MWSSDGERDGDTFGAESARPPEGGMGGSRVWGWASKYAWRLSVAIMLLITAADALLGPRVILIGLLLIGPCCALFQRTAGLDCRGRCHRCRACFAVGPPRRDLGHRGAVRLHRRRLDGCCRLHLGRRDHRIDDQALEPAPLRPGILGRTNRSEVAMEWIRLHRDQIALVAAVVLPLGVAAILVPFRSSFANTASALILVAVIVAVAALGNRISGFVATVSATCVVRLLPHPPLREARHYHRPDIETAMSLFVRIIVTDLAARNRHHRATAVEEADFVGLIHDVSEPRHIGCIPREVVERVRRELVALLHLQACRYESGSADRPICNSSMTGMSSSEEGSGASIAWGCPARRSSCLCKVKAAHWAVSS